MNHVSALTETFWQRFFDLVVVASVDHCNRASVANRHVLAFKVDVSDALVVAQVPAPRPSESVPGINRHTELTLVPCEIAC